MKKHLRPAHRRFVSMLAAVLLLAGCGGGSGGVDSGGTGAPVSYYGSISGFGSIIVNGTHVDESKAQILDSTSDIGSSSDLKLGMDVAVDATALPGGATSASMVRYLNAIVGPVSDVKTTSGVVTVLGQSVRVTKKTLIDPGIAGGVSGIRIGDVLEVYGQLDPGRTRYTATRVLRRTDDTKYMLRGLVSSVDAQARSFVMGGQTISYAQLDAANVPALSTGAMIQATLERSQSNGKWTAASLRDGAPQIPDGRAVSMSGLVSGFSSAQKFSVAGILVDASNASFPSGANLQPGARVTVLGSSIQGRVQATSVTLALDQEAGDAAIELDGTMGALDTTGKTFQVRGVVVNFAGNVQFSGGSAADLSNGRSVQVLGVPSTDGAQVLATSIAFVAN
jgi:hypothetical protein